MPVTRGGEALDAKQAIPLHVDDGCELDAEGHEQRCRCNKLICVINGDVVEIRCNKCKRMTYIYTRGIEGVRVE
ncbi:MAG: hypothetical protein ACYC5Y_06810 [Symbiobacteriia bacterium]